MVDWANLIGSRLGLRLVLFAWYTVTLYHSVEYLVGGNKPTPLRWPEDIFRVPFNFCKGKKRSPGLRGRAGAGIEQNNAKHGEENPPPQNARGSYGCIHTRTCFVYRLHAEKTASSTHTFSGSKQPMATHLFLPRNNVVNPAASYLQESASSLLGAKTAVSGQCRSRLASRSLTGKKGRSKRTKKQQKIKTSSHGTVQTDATRKNYVPLHLFRCYDGQADGGRYENEGNSAWHSGIPLLARD